MSFETQSGLKISVPLWIERIRLCLDFEMPPDWSLDCIVQPHPFGDHQSLPALNRCSKRPVPTPDGVPVAASNPTHRLLAMAAFCPEPERFPDRAIHPLERACRRDMPMIVNPTSDYRVELPDQSLLRCSALFADDCTCFGEERLRVFLGRPDQQFAAELADVLPEEVEAVVDVRDRRLFR